ncbi:MAG TPA: hypothetical protein VFD91_08015, partial [Mariniphaga sp.]|nr:hypothetical protein [Mariniphaga sp.]
TFAYSSEEVQRTLAHEFMHYTQDQYFSITAGNYFFAEAHAPLADRLVWNDTELKDAEPEVFLKESLHSNDGNSSIYDLLGSSWDTGTVPIGNVLEKFFTNSSDANLSSTFLHYMSNLREGSKLNAAKLLTNHTWDEQALNWTWRAYLDEQVESQLKSTLGKEYDAFVRYLIEGSNKKFTILNTGHGNPYTNILENVENNNIGTFTWRIPYAFQEVDELPETEHCQFTVPYLASKVALITNNSSEQAIIVNYQRNHDLHEEEEVYFGKYDHVNQKMILVNISDSLSYSMILDADDADAGKKFQHMAFLLFVNKRCPAVLNPVRDFDADFKLTAMPIFNINDVIYANITDNSIHDYSDGSRSNFIITGCMSGWNKMDLPVVLNNFTSSKRMLNDHTYIIDATFSERMSINTSISLPPAISEYDRKQTIVYDTNTGRMEILQVSKIEYTKGEYYDHKNVFHPAHKDRIYEETQKLVVKNIFDLELKEVSVTDKALVFETTNTQHTLRVLEELSSTIKESTLDEKGNLIDTSTRNLTGTDFSNDNVTINIWINYR